MIYFQNSFSSLTKKRSSCRSFSSQPVDPQTVIQIQNFITSCSNESFRFTLIEKPTGPDAKKIGSYGTISNGSLFIVGIAGKNADMFEFGAVLETIVLFCTDRNVATCWLGSSFPRKKLSEIVQVRKNEMVPVLIPIGYPSNVKTFHEKLLRFFTRADYRKPWSFMFFSENLSTPLTESAAEEYRYALEAVRLAPSAGNKQPWRIIADKQGYHFYLSRNFGYNKSGYDMQRLDMGIAFAHFALVAKEKYCRGTIVEDLPMVIEGLEYIKSWKTH